jgi:hypothetical protein
VTHTPDPFDSVLVLGPDVRGDQLLWAVFNDADPSRHTNRAGQTAPLGIEVQARWDAYDQLGTLGNVVFVEHTIINKGASLLDSAYVSLWSDPDVGAAADDLAGCDPALGLGYAYNAAGNDPIYGASAPAVGYLMLRGPRGYASQILGMTAFGFYINGTDPSDPLESYNAMRGRMPDGSPIIDPVTAGVTTYMLNGDPLAGSGWIDTAPSDKRFTVSSGPFRMFPGDTQRVVVAVIPIQCGDRFSALAELEYESQFVRNFHAGTLTSHGLPDLRAAGVHAPPLARTSCTPYDVSFRIHNDGTLASGPFRASFDQVGLAPPFPFELVAQPFPTDLRPGESIVQTFSRTDAAGAFTGLSRYRLRVDDAFEVFESNEANNELRDTIETAAPGVVSLADVPNDQGGLLRIVWSASSRDVEGSPTPVLQYEIYRRIEPGMATTQAAKHAGKEPRAGLNAALSDPSVLLAGWDYVASAPAHGESQYSMVVSTPADSGFPGAAPSMFFVRAATAAPTVFFDSCPDSAYSLDNLAPATPQNFRVLGVFGGDVHLTWNVSPEQDFRSYRLYRGSVPDFTPSPATQIAELTAASFVDSSPTIPGGYYRVTATDQAGNESGAASAALFGAVPVIQELPRRVAFLPGSPNPFHGRASFRFELPVAAAVQLEVYDGRGRRVRTAFDAVPFEAGRHTWQWDGGDGAGRPVAPGLYFVRFSAGAYRRTVRAILLR